jgi:hypothetical protein
MKLLIMQFSPTSCHFIYFRSTSAHKGGKITLSLRNRHHNKCSGVKSADRGGHDICAPAMRTNAETCWNNLSPPVGYVATLPHCVTSRNLLPRVCPLVLPRPIHGAVKARTRAPVTGLDPDPNCFFGRGVNCLHCLVHGSPSLQADTADSWQIICVRYWYI